MTLQQVLNHFMRYGSLVIFSNIHRAFLMISGFIDMIGHRVGETATIRKSIVSRSTSSRRGFRSPPGSRGATRCAYRRTSRG